MKEIKYTPRYGYFLLALAIFGAFFVLGYSLGRNDEVAEAILASNFDIGGLADSSWLLFAFIFLNNAIKSFIALLLGFFFGIIPIYFLAVNGTLLGLVFSYGSDRTSLPFVMAAILPHGILELSAFILAMGYGLWLGLRFFRLLFLKEPFKPYFKSAMLTFLKVILPMLLVAALIETFLTPFIASRFIPW